MLPLKRDPCHDPPALSQVPLDPNSLPQKKQKYAQIAGFCADEPAIHRDLSRNELIPRGLLKQ
jgi:hypothetical protein